MGNFGYGDKNDRGERLLEFALEHDMMICKELVLDVNARQISE